MLFNTDNFGLRYKKVPVKLVQKNGEGTYYFELGITRDQLVYAYLDSGWYGYTSYLWIANLRVMTKNYANNFNVIEDSDFYGTAIPSDTGNSDTINTYLGKTIDVIYKP